MEMKKALTLLVLATFMVVANARIFETKSEIRQVRDLFPEPLASILLQEVAKNGGNGLNGGSCRDLDQSCIPYVEGYRCCSGYDCSPYPVVSIIPPGISMEPKCVKLPFVSAA